MNMTSFDLLCKGMNPDEAKLFRKILKEWCNGDEDSFPVQLALLTKSQWSAVAQMLIILQTFTDTFENKIADHQKQLAAMLKKAANAGDDKIEAFEKKIAIHTEAMKQVASKSHHRLDETEAFAREIRRQMEQGLRDSDRITKSVIDERHALDGARQRYENSIEWQEAGLQLFALMLAAVVGFIIGWYNFAHPH